MRSKRQRPGEYKYWPAKRIQPHPPPDKPAILTRFSIGSTFHPIQTSLHRRSNDIMPLELIIVTSDKRYHYEQVTQVVLPTAEGQVTILPGHAPMISLVACGVLRVFPAEPDKASSGPLLFALAKGMARIFDDQIVLLMNEAFRHDDIDRDQAVSRRHELALAETSRSTPDPVERQTMEEDIGFTDAQLEVLRIGDQAK
jgi:F-type H+-transporting ATPase subunit epsilon